MVLQNFGNGPPLRLSASQNPEVTPQMQQAVIDPHRTVDNIQLRVYKAQQALRSLLDQLEAVAGALLEHRRSEPAVEDEQPAALEVAACGLKSRLQVR